MCGNRKCDIGKNTFLISTLVLAIMAFCKSIKSVTNIILTVQCNWFLLHINLTDLRDFNKPFSLNTLYQSERADNVR